MEELSRGLGDVQPRARGGGAVDAVADVLEGEPQVGPRAVAGGGAVGAGGEAAGHGAGQGAVLRVE